MCIRDRPGASGYEWSKIEDELAIDHTVYTVDLLGCGRSDKSSITYTNFVYVQMISDFIKKIIGQKTDAVSYTHLDVYKRQAMSLA